MDHDSHHEPNNLLIQSMIIALALIIERLYRLRYLHRGTHLMLSSIEFVRLLRFAMGYPPSL